jgi:hypothetical protein
MIANDATGAVVSSRQPAPYHSRLWVVMTSGRGFRAQDWAIEGAVAAMVIFIEMGLVLGGGITPFDAWASAAIYWAWPLLLWDAVAQSDSLEPLLAAGVRRTDLILGQFLRHSLIYVMFLLASAGLLMVEAILAARFGHFASLAHLHATPCLCAWLILVVTAGGLEMMAYNTLGMTRRMGVGGLICSSMMFAGLFAYIHNPTSLLAAACPLSNATSGVDVITVLMSSPGYAGHFGLPHHLSVNYAATNVVPVTVLFSLAGTAIILLLAIRDLGGPRRRRTH